jgi:SAM-dependent methyltransferase
MESAALTLSGWLRYDLLRRWLGQHDIASVLEIGPGLGALGALIAAHYRYVGVERDAVSAEIAARNVGSAGRVITGTPESVEEEFDLVCAFEVLEHIENDVDALRLWRQRVAPGGWLIVTSPAKMKLWGAHDERAGHFHRYERAEIASKFEAAGLRDVTAQIYGFPLLSALHPIWNGLSARASKEATIDDRTLASGRFRQPPKWLGAVTRSAAIPFAYAQRPFLDSNIGTGVFVSGRRAA